MTELEKFDLWMREVVQNIHYADNNQMSNAYQRIEL